MLNNSVPAYCWSYDRLCRCLTTTKNQELDEGSWYYNPCETVTCLGGLMLSLGHSYPTASSSNPSLICCVLYGVQGVLLRVLDNFIPVLLPIWLSVNPLIADIKNGGNRRMHLSCVFIGDHQTKAK